MHAFIEWLASHDWRSDRALVNGQWITVHRESGIIARFRADPGPVVAPEHPNIRPEVAAMVEQDITDHADVWKELAKH